MHLSSNINETSVNHQHPTASVASTMTLESGVYYLRNVKSRTVLTLSRDKDSVVGWSWYEGKDQKWELGRLGSRGWFIRSLYSCDSHYLTISNGLGDGSSLTVNEYPIAWEIKNEPREGNDAYCIRWPNARWTVDLDRGGNDCGRKVHIWSWHGEQHQHWKLIRCQDSDQVRTSLSSPVRTIIETKTTTTITKITTTSQPEQNEQSMEDGQTEGTLHD